MNYQAPAPSLDLTPDPDPAPAFPGSPEGHEARPDAERNRLLERITGASVPSRLLCNLIIEIEGIASFSDQALQRMCAILDVIETNQSTNRDMK